MRNVYELKMNSGETKLYGIKVKLRTVLYEGVNLEEILYDFGYEWEFIHTYLEDIKRDCQNYTLEETLLQKRPLEHY
ncbi:MULTISPECIES: hypothetical protein [Bacillaceae]|uniref:Uncharacterized protein n=2 Tax=Bacillaceae TaxID=186817 RepID=A0A9D5I0H5_9BACI|nr:MULTISPECIES: hypothetical protein [Bacillaceae]KQL56527.1 hypothetical protein AN965_12400 [Alkalicoccobacillus plakortidis]MBG9784929.1 hypothetical protein [Shouchella lehensis]RQW18628.1 hypothetical protein EH196_16790 [Bacillus sp. C1-1]TES46347.1 hypothetical protein E2L03_16745 [Shouchella lehensis]